MSGFKRSLAIVLGINRYENGISPLHTAIADAKAIAQVLQDEHHYQVKLCLDETATLANLNGLLHNLHFDQDDRLLFYFAGHGIALHGDEGPQGYLIPQDARLGDVLTYLPMTQVEAALTQMSCRHCLIILDCCFAGAFRWSSTRKLVSVAEVIHKERYDRFIQDSAWQVITSASHDQYASDALELKNDRGVDPTRTGHSPFAAALMDALSGSADVYPPAKAGRPAGDGVITATELYLYLRDAVEVATDARNLRQTPGIWCLKKHDKGEYIFLTPGHVLNLDPAPSFDNPEENNPYRGLKSYEKEHRALFFGRMTLIENLCNFVCDHPLTVVLGASGSGKSSLVKAGLIPHLEELEIHQQQLNNKLQRERQSHQHKHKQWQVLAIIRPGETPLTALQDALQKSSLSIAELSKASPFESESVVSAIRKWSQNHSATRLILVVDQIEELITQCSNEQEREQFLQFITTLLKECAEQIHVVLTLRSDFEPQFSEHPALKSEWVASRFVVPAMTREELRDVIEEPASTRVVYFEMDEQRGNLVDQLINEVAAMPGALPLLSFALSELYFKLAQRFHQTNTTGDIPDRVITWQDYDELGGVTRSLTERADQVCDELIAKDSAYAQTIQNVMLRMVNIDGGSATKRKVPDLELKYSGNENDRVHQVLERYSTARLLVRGNDKGISYVEPAHDALIQGWQKLREWIQAEGENLTLQRQLTPAAIEWQQKQQRRFLWHNNPRLSLLKQKYVEQTWLNQLEQTFVQKSIRQHQQDTFQKWGIAATVVLLALGGTVFWRNAQINQMLDLQGSAEGRLLQNQDLEALIESIKAAKSLHHPLLQMFPPREALRNEVQETLQNAVYQVRERNRLKSDQGRITSVAFSPDGRWIATAQNGTVSFWDRSGKPLTGLNAPDVGGNIRKISFTNNSEYLVAEVLNQETNQIDAKRWNITGAFQLQEGQDANSLGFNDSENDNATEAGYRTMNVDRTLVASAEIQSETISIYRIDPNSGQIQQQLAAIHNTPRFNSSLPLVMRFSPDSQRLAAASMRDNTIYLWDLGGNLLAQFKHAGGVQDLKFSPDSQQLATVGQDGIVRIWQHLEGSQQDEYRGYAGQDRIHTIQLSSTNANQVAIGTNSGRVRLWNLSMQQERVLSIPASSVDGLRFSADERFLAVGSQSGQTWIWNLATQQISPDMAGSKSSDLGTLQRSYGVNSDWIGEFSPEGQWFVLGGNPKIHDIFNPGSAVDLPRKPSVSEGDRAFDWLQAFAFDPSKQILAAGGFEGTLELWNWKQLLATSGYTQPDANQQFKQEIPTDMSIQAIAFSPRGNLVATAGIDSGVAIVRLWDFAGQQQVELRGHEAKINAVAFSLEGNRIATASEDGTVRLWSLNGQQLAVFKGHDAVKQVAFRDSEQLISAGFSNQENNQPGSYDLWQVKTWQIQNLDQLLDQGCSWVQGYLENSRDLDNQPEFQADRTLCQGISSQGSDQIASAPIINLIPTELPAASMEIVD